MRVLVTGGTGFVGSHTARALLDAGHRVRLLVRDASKVRAVFDAERASRFEIAAGDMTDAKAVARALDGQDALVHAAALVALGRKSAARVRDGNRAGVENVVGGAVAAGLERIIYVSSAVTGLADRLGDGETQMGRGASAYTRSKTECEAYVRALQARGAPIRTTYPGGVIGPDDPGTSEANRGLRTLFRDLHVVTAGGLQMVDVRDVARAHARLLEAPPAHGRHVLGGHFLRWSELLDRFEELTGRRLLRLPVPAPLLRASGAAADIVRRIWDFELPLTHEATVIMTRWVPAAPLGPEDRALGIDYRDPRETLRDTLTWMHQSGILSARQIGALHRAPSHGRASSASVT